MLLLDRGGSSALLTTLILALGANLLRWLLRWRRLGLRLRLRLLLARCRNGGVRG